MSRTSCVPASALLGHLALAACVPRDAGFSAAQALVRERANLDARWRAASGEKEDAQIRELLSKPLDETTVMQLAVLNNAELQARLADLGVARADLLAASLPSNPEVEGDVVFIRGGRPQYGLSASLDLTHLLFIPWRRAAALAALDAEKLAAAGAILDFAFAARTAFYEHEAAVQRHELVKTVLAATASSFDIAKRLHDAGNITDLMLANERAFYEEARQEVAEAELAAQVRRERLNEVMGLAGESVGWSSTGRLVDAPDEPKNLGELERQSIERNLELQELRARYSAAASRYDLAVAQGFIPELRAGVRAEREEGPWAVGPSIGLSLPIFNNGQAERARAQAEQRRYASELEARAVAIRAAARSARAALEVARAKVKHYRDVLLPVRQAIVDETQRQYNAMHLGVFELIAAKQAEVRIAQGYVDALREYWLARAAVDQLVAGRLPGLEMPRGTGFRRGSLNSQLEEGH